MSQQFYTKISNKVIELFTEKKMSVSAFSLYVLLCKQSSKFVASRSWILKNGFTRRKLETAENELAGLNLLTIIKGKGGRSYTKYIPVRYDMLKDYTPPTCTKRYSTKMVQCQNVQATCTKRTRVRVQNDTLLINKLIKKEEEPAAPSLDKTSKDKPAAVKNAKHPKHDILLNPDSKNALVREARKISDATSDESNFLVSNVLMRRFNVSPDYLKGVYMFLAWDQFWVVKKPTFDDIAKNWKTISSQYEQSCYKFGDVVPSLPSDWSWDNVTEW